MAFSLLFLGPFVSHEMFLGQHIILNSEWKTVGLVGCSMAVSIALNNYSWMSISLPLNQTIRAAIPVVTCILGILLE